MGTVLLITLAVFFVVVSLRLKMLPDNYRNVPAVVGIVVLGLVFVFDLIK